MSVGSTATPNVFRNAEKLASLSVSPDIQIKARTFEDAAKTCSTFIGLGNHGNTYGKSLGGKQ